MLERYSLPEQRAAEREFMPHQAWWRFRDRCNVAAGQFVPAIRIHEARSEASMMAWGLVPASLEGALPTDRLLTVARELLDCVPGCREAWHGGQRCILPASGYYLWRLMPAGHRQPYYLRLCDRSAFGIAAVWDRWADPEGDVLESCCAICVSANALVRRIDPGQDRMPAILRRRDYDLWLRGNPAEAASALEPYEAEAMEAHAVSPRINSPRAEGRGLIRPVRLSA